LLNIIKKNYQFFVFLVIYFFIGSYLSVINGITSDEYHQQLNWEVHQSAIINFFKSGNYDELLNHGDKYQGVAFNLITQPFSFFFHKLISNLNGLTNYGGWLVSKHIAILLTFSVSGIFFYLLSLKITNNLIFAFISTSLYLLYPYLFGHAQFNEKDIPFLSFWLINTYISLTIVENLFLEQKISTKKIFLLSIFTAFLIGIRTVGLLICLQYLLSLLIIFNIKKIDINNFIKKNWKHFLIFSVTLLIFIYIFNPIFWHNPFVEVLNSINVMSKYWNEICTLTLGTCMNSFNLPSSYYFIWLFFKLPIIVILGILLFPFVERKIFNGTIGSIYYLTLLLSFFLILIIFILKNVAVYDELRHVLFLVPLIFLVGLTNLFYFNKKLFTGLGIIVIFFFFAENFSLYPYQYTWLNSFAKFTNIEKNFEIDYWGVSNKNLTKKINDYAIKNSIDKNTCIYGDIFAKEFLIKKNFTCFKTYSQLDEAKQKPLFAYKNLRNVKRSNPKDCKLIWNETYNYTFYKKKISVGTVWFCS
tara:strand:- start:1547 stop:3136 length:1590 start_codon:yes stop_codon:yes gene_type:complete